MYTDIEAMWAKRLLAEACDNLLLGAYEPSRDERTRRFKLAIDEATSALEVLGLQVTEKVAA